MQSSSDTKHAFWHIQSPRHTTPLEVHYEPPLTAEQVALEYKGCDCRPMTEEEIAQWLKG